MATSLRCLVLGCFGITIGSSHRVRNVDSKMEMDKNITTAPMNVAPKGGWILHRAAYAETPTRATWCGTYDFAVRITLPVPNRPGYVSYCSGTIVGNKVLTAAHCIEDLTTPSGIQVQSCRASYQVISMQSYPRYDPRAITGDVAILQVSGHHRATSRVSLMPNRPIVGKGLNLAGFGTDEHGKLGDFNVLKDRTMKVLPCHSGTDSSIACISSGPRSRSASCAGDSGGPWFTSVGTYVQVYGAKLLWQRRLRGQR